MLFPPQERTIFIREASRKTSRTFTYVLSSFLTLLPVLLLLSATFASCLYWTVGLTASLSCFLTFIAVSFLTFALANSFVMLCTALLPSYTVAATACSAAFSFFLLFSGFLVSK